MGKADLDVADEVEGLSYGLLPQLLGYQLRRTQVAIFKHFAQSVGQAEDITPGLFGMLEVIAANPRLSQSRLAEAMGVDRSAIVKVADQLEARGLIRRHSAPNDRRSYCLELTPVGCAAVGRVEGLVRGHEAAFAHHLTTEERQTLLRLLDRLGRPGGRVTEKQES